MLAGTGRGTLAALLFGRHDTMDSSTRFDIYAPIHKALRRFMTDTLDRLSCLDLEDDRDVDRALGQLDSLLDAARRHLKHENEFIHPVLERHRTGASHRIATEHGEHLDAIATLSAQAEVLRADRSAMAAHLLYRQLAAFIAENFEHMDGEETRHNQLLWAACSDDDLQAIEGCILASIGPQEMSLWMRWMLPAFNPDERVTLVRSLPPEVRPGVMSQARAALDDLAWSKLCRALGEPAVPGLVE